ncbi:MAG: hypothetical protein IJ493_11430 [Clostridia bacterium]|nr:hypothetical protein [Clostridia bacterium]
MNNPGFVHFENVCKFYQNGNHRFGFNEDDIAAVRETEGVKTVMPHYVMDTLADTGSGSALVASIYGYDYDNMQLAQMKLVEENYLT